MKSIENILGARMGGTLRAGKAKITEINQRYAHPKIKLSKTAAFALLGLRLYLIVLVLLLAYKFYTIVAGV